jgi:hypothetical protein
MTPVVPSPVSMITMDLHTFCPALSGKLALPAVISYASVPVIPSYQACAGSRHSRSSLLAVEQAGPKLVNRRQLASNPAPQFVPGRR